MRSNTSAREGRIGSVGTASISERIYERAHCIAREQPIHPFDIQHTQRVCSVVLMLHPTESHQVLFVAAKPWDRENAVLKKLGFEREKREGAGSLSLVHSLQPLLKSRGVPSLSPL